LASIGGMDMCTTSFSIVSPFFIAIVIELLIYIGKWGISLRLFRNTTTLAQDQLRVDKKK
jgi:hypothetical protein